MQHNSASVVNTVMLECLPLSMMCDCSLRTLLHSTLDGPGPRSLTWCKKWDEKTWASWVLMETHQKTNRVLSNNMKPSTKLLWNTERKDINLVMIATLLNFSGEEAIKDFNTLQLVRGHEKKLDKILGVWEVQQPQEQCSVWETILADNAERLGSVVAWLKTGWKHRRHLERTD